MLNEQQAQHLVQTYSDKILRLSYSYLKHTQDAEDICQTVFLKYLTLQPEFESDEHEKAWILRTTVNACKDHLRSAFFRRTAPLEDAAFVAAPAAGDSEILDAMNALPKDYRIILHLFYYEGYSAREIAHILGKTPNSVEQALSRGRKKLRMNLTRERSL